MALEKKIEPIYVLFALESARHGGKNTLASYGFLLPYEKDRKFEFFSEVFTIEKESLPTTLRSAIENYSGIWEKVKRKKMEFRNYKGKTLTARSDNETYAVRSLNQAEINEIKEFLKSWDHLDYVIIKKLAV